jgi:reverse transcriptase-like protein
VHRPTCQFLESCDIIFDEGGPVQHCERIVIKPDDTDKEGTEGAEGTEGVSTTRNGINTDTRGTDTSISSQPNTSSDSESETEIEGILTSPPSIATSCPKHTIHVPTHDNDPQYTVSSYGTQKHTKEHASVAQADTTSDPQTYAQAMACSNAAEWKLACNDKCHAFEHMGIYEVIPCPKGQKVVGSKWVFHIKHGPDGTIQKYKACVITQGFTQIKNIDYDETFAPVAKFTSLCTILTIAAEEDLEVHQMDVKSAYLNGVLKEEIFMEPPPGFDVPEGMVLCLVKAVYGTKQGGRIWYENIRSKLEAMGYKHTEADHAVFTCVQDSKHSIIALYIDDITIASKNLKIISQDKEALKKHYEMTDLGEISWILGMHVTRDHAVGWIALSQEKYIMEVLERFRKTNIRPISTPMLTNEQLKKLTSPEINMQLYQSVIGTLMYPMLGMCPDLAFTVAALGQHAANPGGDYQHALDHVFQYLRAMSNQLLIFQHGVPGGSVLHRFIDANWASNSVVVAQEP